MAATVASAAAETPPALVDDTAAESLSGDRRINNSGFALDHRHNIIESSKEIVSNKSESSPSSSSRRRQRGFENANNTDDDASSPPYLSKSSTIGGSVGCENQTGCSVGSSSSKNIIDITNRLRLPNSPTQRKSSSGSSLSVTPTPTPSPTSSAKHVRIQRFINFFSTSASSSGDQQQYLSRYSPASDVGGGAQILPGSSTSLSSCHTGVSSSNNNDSSTNHRSRSSALSSEQQRRQGGRLITTTIRGTPTIEGPLAHKQLVSLLAPVAATDNGGGGGKKNRATGAGGDARNWRDNWAILHGSTLYLCRERPESSSSGSSEQTSPPVISFVTECDHPTSSSSSSSVSIIDVESCIADIAYDYVKRKNTFRVTTQSQTEHLFQAADSETMIKWIECLQRCSIHENQRDGLSNSMALIIKRYEAAQSVSPSMKHRRSADNNNQTIAGAAAGGKKSSASPTAVLSSYSSSSTLSPPNNIKKDIAAKENIIISNDSATSYSANSLNRRSYLAGINLNSSTNSSSGGGGKAEKMEKGDQTPGKSRKWRRVRKSGSCPVSSERGGSASGNNSNPDAMFGASLEECPTSGEDDYVPLIVQLCVKVVESQGLEAVGVYRIPGNTAAVNSLIATLDKGFENANFNDSRWRDVNVVSSLLKAYFRKLPDPLLTDKLYQHFIEASRIENHNQKMKRIRALIEKLPRSNYETLKYLIFHLKRVVSHSSINKMATRNLALMFGPSLVRPCGDSSMTTMVTHMSDQCKIVELLITYCDWLFAQNKDLPCAAVELTSSSSLEQQQQPAEATISDITRLLSKVKTSEEDSAERSKDNIVKSILNVRRRGSRKSTNGGGKNRPGSNGALEPPPVAGHNNHHVNGHHRNHRHHSSSHDEESYNERNIDEEIIKSRQKQQQQQLVASSGSVKFYAGDSKNCETPPPNIENTTTTAAAAAGKNGDCRQQENEVPPSESALRRQRQRQDNIYAARRIFIVGSSAECDEPTSNTPSADTVAKMDLLARHSRHLNGNPHSLEDVLSPETREKIRRLQADSQLLRTKGERQSEQLRKLAGERERIEAAWERAKRDYEQDDFLDTLAENPTTTTTRRAGFASSPHIPGATVITATVVNADALSISSDYSTASSSMMTMNVPQAAIGGFNLNHPARQQQAPPPPPPLMSISCTGSLLTTTTSEEKCSPPIVELSDSQGEEHRKPTSSSDGSVSYRRNAAAANSCSSNRSEAVRRRSQIRHSSKVSYDDDNDQRHENGLLVDQNVNSTTTKSQILSSSSSSNGGTKTTTTTTPSGNGGGTSSRISQKIKFRSKSSSAEKRSDNRRHTLTDMETIKNVLFGGFRINSTTTTTNNNHNHNNRSSGNTKDNHHRLVSITESSSSAAAAASNNPGTNHRSSTGASSTKAGKLKTWFKESFRKSSPDLCDAGGIVDETT